MSSPLLSLDGGGGGGSFHLCCPACGLQSRTHALHLSHLAEAHPSRLDEAAVGRLGKVLLFQSGPRLFHCILCFYSCREFTKLYKHVISKHCCTEGEDRGEEEEEEEEEEAERKREVKRSSQEEEGVGVKEENTKEEEARKRRSKEEREVKRSSQEEEERKRSSQEEEERKRSSQEEEGVGVKEENTKEEEKKNSEEEVEARKRKRGSEEEEEQEGKKKKRWGEEVKVKEEQRKREVKRSSKEEEDVDVKEENTKEEEARKRSSEEEEEQEGEKKKRWGEEVKVKEEQRSGEAELQQQQESGQKPVLSLDASGFRCLICSYSHKKKSVAISHMVRRHAVSKSDANRRISRGPGAEEWEELPGARPSAQQRQEEARAMEEVVHTVAGKYVCAFCGWKSKLKGFAISHVVRSHHVRRPHECKECGRSFFLSSRLQEHVRSVHRPGRFYCPFCPFRSETLGGFRRHCTRCSARS